MRIIYVETMIQMMKKDDDNEHNEDDDVDDVDDVGKLPAHRSPRPRMAGILSTCSGSNKKTKHA